MKISIIIPVYNSEKYLNACVDSVINQSYENIEAVLVDDGSEDSSSEICDRYAEADSRVKVLHKKNGGVSSARNAGMQLCSGDYIMFVDADDWLDADACSKAAKLFHSDVDLYIYNTRAVRGNQIQNYFTNRIPAGKEELVSDIIFGRRNQNPYMRAVWGKAFSRRLVEKLKFDEALYIGEDACFLLECVLRLDMQQIRFADTAWYNYRMIPNSAVRSYKADLMEQSIRQYLYIERLLDRSGQKMSGSIKNAMMRFSWGAAISLKANSMKKRLKSKDFQRWLTFAKDSLLDFGVERKELPRFHYLCSRVYRYWGGRVTEGVVWLYIICNRNT